MKDIKWDNNFAYGIGLLATDGCLSSDRRHIEFSSKDMESIVNFKKAFDIKNKIGFKTRGSFPKKQYYRVQFGNKKLYKFLLEIGLHPHKSYTLGPLKIPKAFFADFLRGVIDGDGTIGYFMHPESRKKQFRIRIISASKEFLVWLNKQINKLLKIEGMIRQSTRAYELCYYKAASRRLMDFIYYNASIICLKRKLKVAKLMNSRGWRNWDTR